LSNSSTGDTLASALAGGYVLPFTTSEISTQSKGDIREYNKLNAKVHKDASLSAAGAKIFTLPGTIPHTDPHSIIAGVERCNDQSPSIWDLDFDAIHREADMKRHLDQKLRKRAKGRRSGAVANGLV
jgi:hypothetical protein